MDGFIRIAPKRALGKAIIRRHPGRATTGAMDLKFIASCQPEAGQEEPGISIPVSSGEKSPNKQRARPRKRWPSFSEGREAVEAEVVCLVVFLEVFPEIFREEEKEEKEEVLSAA